VIGGTRIGTVLVWDRDRDAPPRELRGPRGYVMSAAFSLDGRTLAAGGWGTAHLWEVATWQPQVRLDAGSGDTLALAFAPTGRTLVAGGLNGWVGVYDLPGIARAGKQKPRTIGRGERDNFWRDLGGKDAASAFRALWALADVPDEAMSLLEGELKPVPKLDSKRVDQLVTDLNDAKFDVRERAATALEGLGDGVRPTLNRLLAKPPSAEVRARAKAILDKLAEREVSAEGVALGRRLMLLEQLRTPAARTLIEQLAAGEPEATVTGQSKAALSRLGSRAR
jgi:hypothetical protein